LSRSLRSNATDLKGSQAKLHCGANRRCTPGQHPTLTYYLRERREEFNWFIHAAVPIFGTVFLFPVLLTALGMGRTLLRFIQPLPYPISLCGPILGAWYFIGLVYLLYLSKRHPRRIQETARIFVD
jgi:hypothetical protein